MPEIRVPSPLFISQAIVPVRMPPAMGPVRQATAGEGVREQRMPLRIADGLGCRRADVLTIGRRCLPMLALQPPAPTTLPHLKR